MKFWTFERIMLLIMAGGWLTTLYYTHHNAYSAGYIDGVIHCINAYSK